MKKKKKQIQSVRNDFLIVLHTIRTYWKELANSNSTPQTGSSRKKEKSKRYSKRNYNKKKLKKIKKKTK